MWLILLSTQQNLFEPHLQVDFEASIQIQILYEQPPTREVGLFW